MIELARGLSAGALRAVAALEMRVLAVDGGRLKLEWGVLRSRLGQDVEDVLWWEGDRFVCPRGSVAGRHLALSRAAVLEHSEHALVLLDAPTDGPTDPRTELRTAMPADARELSRLLTAAFGGTPSDLHGRLAEDSSRTLVVERESSAVTTEDYYALPLS